MHDLLSAEPPFATAFFDATHDTEDAAADNALRYRAVHTQLAQAGTPDRLLRALTDAIDSTPPARGRAGRFLIAADGAVLVDRYLPAVPPEPVTRLSALPYLVPLVTATPQRVPHVIAVVDKLGADLKAIDVDGTTLADVTVEGDEHPVHKVGGGGWSHRNIQSHTEETVLHNIAKVAAEIGQLIGRTGARLLILAGAVEPRTLLRKALPDSCAQIAVEIDSGTRAKGADDQAFHRDVAEQVTQRWLEEREELLEKFHIGLSRDSKGLTDHLAVQGIQATTAALREANVAVLVISDPTLGERTVWRGERHQLVAVDREELAAFGSATSTEARADEALPVAALAVGADLLATEEKLADGVGALLRHT